MRYPINTFVGITTVMQDVERPLVLVQEQIFKKEFSILPKDSVKHT